MSVLHTEIFEQPAAIERAIQAGREPVTRLVAEAKRRGIKYLVLAARGTSDNAATYAKYLFQIICGVPVALAAPSVHTMYDANVDYRDALVIGVSQSGAGTDIIEVIAHARKNNALTAAITNTPDSLLALTAEHVLLCNAGVEKAVAATKTYTTTLALFALLAATWSENTELLHAINRLEKVTTEALQSEASVIPLAQTLMHAERLITVARGLHLCTAVEASLKIAETTYTPTQSFSSADLLHGPIASVAVRTACLLFMPEGKTNAMMEEVAGKLHNRGARVLRFAPSGTPEAVVHLTNSGTELLAPLVDIIPAQLLAYNLCIARGLNPDNPQGLTKVTVTR